MIEVVKRVFEPAGHNIDYQVLNWARAIEESRQGKHTGIIGAIKSDAEDFVFPANELSQSINVYATRSDDSWTFTGVTSLAGRTLGVIRDYSYGEELDAYIKKNLTNKKRLQVASGDNALELNFRKLLKKRIDTVLEGKGAVILGRRQIYKYQ
jgi:polar amino acid transport system substrate-binding protein